MDNINLVETALLTVEVESYRCEVVRVCGQVLLYIDGHFSGELYEEDNSSDYLNQILEILDL